MFVSQIQPALAVPVSETVMFQILDSDTVGRLIVLENTGANIINYRFQKSTDRVTWSDVAATNPAGPVTLNPGTAAAYVLSVADPYVRLLAAGNSTLSFALLRHKAFSVGSSTPLVVI